MSRALAAELDCRRRCTTRGRGLRAVGRQGVAGRRWPARRSRSRRASRRCGVRRGGPPGGGPAAAGSSPATVPGVSSIPGLAALLREHADAIVAGLDGVGDVGCGHRRRARARAGALRRAHRRRAAGGGGLRRPQDALLRWATPGRPPTSPPARRSAWACLRNARARFAALRSSMTSGGSASPTRYGTSRRRWGPGEWERVRLQPYLTERMLSQSAPLAPLARDRRAAPRAARRLRLPARPAGRGDPPARILGAADAYQAMREPRPYRPPHPPVAAARRLRAEVRAGRLDADAVEGVLGAAGHRAPRRREGPAGLTAREVEVLRLVARGMSNKRDRRAAGRSRPRPSATTSSTSTPRSARRAARPPACSPSSTACCRTTASAEQAGRSAARAPRARTR